MPKPKTTEPTSYEAALQELEQLVVRIESGQLPLDQLLAGYKRGAADSRTLPEGIAPLHPGFYNCFPRNRHRAARVFPNALAQSFLPVAFSYCTCIRCNLPLPFSPFFLPVGSL